MHVYLANIQQETTRTVVAADLLQLTFRAHRSSNTTKYGGDFLLLRNMLLVVLKAKKQP